MNRSAFNPLHSLLAISAIAMSGVMIAPAAAQAPAAAPAAPEVTLTRLDCGTPVNNDVARFSDTYAYSGLKVLFTYSCYLIKHGDEYLLWDTGHAMTAGAAAPKVSVVDQLADRKSTRLNSSHQ